MGNYCVPAYVLTDPSSAGSKELAKASHATIKAISWIKALNSLGVVVVDRNWLIFARMQGCFDM